MFLNLKLPEFLCFCVKRENCEVNVMIFQCSENLDFKEKASTAFNFKSKNKSKKVNLSSLFKVRVVCQ